MDNKIVMRGVICITSDIEVVYNYPLDPFHKIINLDEDGILPENEHVLGGTCLLPPIPAKIAEADGNEMLYDDIYHSYLMEPYQTQFASALISYLYKGGNLLLFLPELGYTNTINKLVFHFYTLYGIHIGIIGAQNPADFDCYYNYTYIPIWLNLMYVEACTIDTYQYLHLFPADAYINTNPAAMNKLIEELKPLENTLEDKVKYIINLHKRIQEKPDVRPAIYAII